MTDQIQLQSNDFELFDVPRRFEQSRALLDERWKQLQKQAHPDRFASQGPAAQRLAMQWSVRINEAYQRLKDPLRRAAYLCELHGHAVNAHSNTAMPGEFLMQQMAWREALDEANDAPALQALARQVAEAREQTLAACAVLLDEQQDYAGAVQQVRALMFIQRFEDDVQDRLDSL